MAKVSRSLNKLMTEIIQIKNSDAEASEKEILLTALKHKHTDRYNENFQKAIAKLTDRTMTYPKDKDGNPLEPKLASLWARRYQNG